MQPSPKRIKREGSATASTSELTDETPEAAEGVTGKAQLFTASLDAPMPPGCRYDAASGLLFWDDSVPLPKKCLKEWADESPKMTNEEMMNMARQTTAEMEEMYRQEEEMLSSVCVLCFISYLITFYTI